MPLLLFYLISPSFGLYEDLSMVVCRFVTGIAALFEKKTGLTFIAPPDFAGEPYLPLAPLRFIHNKNESQISLELVCGAYGFIFGPF